MVTRERRKEGLGGRKGVEDGEMERGMEGSEGGREERKEGGREGGGVHYALLQLEKFGNVLLFF